MYDKKVIIIGGGICGLSSALFFNKIGFKCKIFEKYPLIKNIGAGLQIFPNGIKILEELDLSEMALRKAALMNYTRFKNYKGKEIGIKSMGTIENPETPAVTIKRNIIHNLILEKVLQTKNIDLIFEKELTGIKNNGKVVEAYFKDGSIANGSMLLGCDGINSNVRKFVDNEYKGPKELNMVGFLGFVKSNQIKKTFHPKKNMELTFGEQGLFGYALADNFEHNKNPDILWWGYINKKKLKKKDIKLLTNKQITETLRKNFSKWRTPINELISKTSEYKRINVSTVYGLKSWSKHNVLILGDAAHAQSPLSGQGLSLALEDSFFISQLFKKMPAQSIEEKFILFESIRKKRTDKIVKQSNNSSKGLMIFTPKFILPLRDFIFNFQTTHFSDKWNNWVFKYDIQNEIKSLTNIK